MWDARAPFAGAMSLALHVSTFEDFLGARVKDEAEVSHDANHEQTNERRHERSDI